MGARLTLAIVGAVLMIASTFIPTIFFPSVSGGYFGKDVDGPVLYWIFGEVFAWVIETREYTSGGSYSYHTTYGNFRPDVFGMICTTIIIAAAVLAIVLGATTESKAALVGGVLGLVTIIFFYVSVMNNLFYTRVYSIVSDGNFPYPFIGFFVCIVGGILALVGGTLEKY